MKKIIFAMALIPQFSHAYIVACSKGLTLLPELQVEVAENCSGGLAIVIGPGESQCTRSEDDYVRGEGLYRACVRLEQNGFVTIVRANFVGDE
ncbi:hypothetical protein [Bdellovibrio sp. HCB209]|uniref:hypothetical protein n=1 Tax=Bdellovibrio sp. HCB209 TaxID=3394354 RepID=UPI0039B50430